MKPTVQFLERWLNESPNDALRHIPDIIERRKKEIIGEMIDIGYLESKVNQIVAEKQKEQQGKSDERN